MFRFKNVFIDSNTPNTLYNLKKVGFFVVLVYTRSYQNYDFLDRWHALKVISVLKYSFLLFRKPWSPNLTASDFMLRFDSMGHVCDLRYFRLSNLAYFGTPTRTQSVQFGGILLLWLKKWVLGAPYPIPKGQNMFPCTYLGVYQSNKHDIIWC